jgi:hypothetical protein
MSDKPTKYEVTAGTWDTDMQFTTAQQKSADGCIEFLGTSPGVDPEMTYSEFIPVEPSRPYSWHAWFRANNTAAQLDLEVDWYSAAEAFISTTSFYSASPTAANTWYRVGAIADAPSTAYYAKPVFRKTEDAYLVYVDEPVFRARPVAFDAYANSVTSIGTSWTTITLDVEVYDYGSVFDHAASYRFTAPETGIYAISAAVGAVISATDHLRVRLDINGTYQVYGAIVYSSNAALLMTAPVTAPALLLTRGQYVELQSLVTGAGAHNSQIGQGITYMMGARTE